MKYLFLALLAVPLASFAISEQDVRFQQRKCSLRNDPGECSTYRSMARQYQMQERDNMEYDAALRSKQRMEADRRVYIEQNNYYGGDNRGGYNWNSKRNKYCNHNSDGSIYKCYN